MFLGAMNKVRTFNFDGGRHLADQGQEICVRREEGMCRICWTTALVTDFQVSGIAVNAKNKVKNEKLAKF